MLEKLSDLQDSDKKQEEKIMLKAVEKKPEDLFEKYEELIAQQKSTLAQLPNINIPEPKKLYDWEDYSYDDR
jgi:hypothetical protein